MFSRCGADFAHPIIAEEGFMSRKTMTSGLALIAGWPTKGGSEDAGEWRGVRGQSTNSETRYSEVVNGEDAGLVGN